QRTHQAGIRLRRRCGAVLRERSGRASRCDARRRERVPRQHGRRRARRTRARTRTDRLMTNDVRDALQTLVDGVEDGRTLQEMVEASPLAVLVANDHGSFVMANAVASELTGYSLSELRNLSLWQITPDVLEREAEILWRAFLQQREQFGTYRLIKKN